MSKTVEEFAIMGRTPAEVKNEALRWFNSKKMNVMENQDLMIKARWGLGLTTAPKYFQVFLSSVDGGVKIRIEGWISAYGKEQSFSRTALLGAVPRREGWHAMEQLSAALKALQTSLPSSPG
ncbi:MAG: hypothetical protein ACE14S_12200 [Candidatus Bathyarchaeia archaeon]